MSDLIRYEVEAGVATMTLCDPPANTYTHEMLKALDARILEARMDDDVHVIVLTGDGEKFFCAGANINMLDDVTPTFKYYFCLHANETLNRLENTPKLVIAALNGHTVGGGLEVALAADLRVAKKDAGKIGLPEVALGVLPGTGGTQRLTRLLGRSKAFELMAMGQTFSVDDAAALGLVNEVFEADGFRDAVKAYAQKFVPPAKASKAVGLIKRAVVAGGEVPFESGLALERELQQQLFTSADSKEGIRAYVEKRKAKFTGK